MAAKEKSSSRWLAWLAPILFLLAAVVAAVPASASMAGALETRAWEKTSAPLKSRPVESLQLLNLHQPKAIAGYNDALGSPLAAETPAAGEKSPSSPTGSRSQQVGTSSDNPPTTINGRQYSGHAIDRMQGRGLTPSVIEDTIQPGNRLGPGNTPGTSEYYSPTNGVTVIIDDASGRVITTY